MTELFPVFFAGATLIILSLLVIAFFVLLNRRWWRIRRIRILSLLLPLSGLVSITIWTLGIFALKKTVMIIGSFLTALILVLILALLLSLPVSGAFNFLHDYLEKRSRRRDRDIPKKVPSPAGVAALMPRRRFLKTAAAVAPTLALTSAVSGTVHAFAEPRVYLKQISFSNLPPFLDGLRILHISDIHLGYYVWIDHVERLLEDARQFSPDIVFATGDLSDRLDIYGDLLRLLASSNPPLGVYASLGNHEYYRGIQAVLKIFDQGPVPLLVNRGVMIKRNGGAFYLGGADDPRHLSGRYEDFFRDTIERTMRDAPTAAFTILLSHRPDGFEEAAKAGVDLTLSGHTHGGQVGFAGRPVFETLMAKNYLWGVYEKGQSRLHTSAGVGHWFPFRLGCPAEAPVLELKRS